MTVKTVTVLAFSATVVPLALAGAVLAVVLFTPVPVAIPARKAQAAIVPTSVYDANGQLLTVFRRFDSNIPMGRKDVPRVLRQAVLASEDRRFYAHQGVDIKGLARAVRRDLKSGEAEQGASTITQQLVKTVYYPEEDVRDAQTANATPFRRTLDRGWRKLRIAVIANRLDRELSKDEILFEYLSNVFLGNGAYGMAAASETYFRKPISALTASEAATLVGIIPAPSKYEPRGNLSNAEFKRKATLRQMFDVGYLNEVELNQALAQELWPDVNGAPPPGQPVTIFYGPRTVDTQYPYFVDYVRRYLIARYGDAAVYGGGLRVTTTIDPRLQAAAEKSAANTLGGTSANLELSIVSVEPLTGYVKALVGGRDFAAPGGQVNLALGDCPTPERLKRLLKGRAPKLAPTCTGRTYVDGGGSGRSPGSSIKPIVLAAAFAQGVPPTQVVSGAQYVDPRCKKAVKGCVINNYEGASYGPVDLRQATIRSVNTAYARLGYDVVGVENVAKMAQRLGITSAWYDPARHGPSYALGGIDVSPLEMAAAYSVFAGRGLRAPATPILSVVDSTGKVLEDNTRTRPKRVLTQAVADNVNQVLQGVVTEGTGKRAALGDRPVAGKTGTSQGYGNAWFVGYTPTLSTAVWMGYRDRPRPLYGIRGVARVAGGTLPAATWSSYMKVAMDGVAITTFDEAAPIKRPKKLSVAEIKARKLREGIDPGVRRRPSGTDTSSFISSEGPAPLVSPPVDDSFRPSEAVTTIPAAAPPVSATADQPVPIPAPARATGSS
jgi:penicillin-binding protein 1A